MKHLALHLALFLMPAAGLLAAAYDPAWAAIAPARTIVHFPRPGAGDGENGAALVKAAADLQPGDKLEIGAGTYSVEPMWDLRVSGTAQAPVWIVAAKDARVIITRPDARQNVLNIGQGGPVGFLALRGLEITGGSHGVRIGQCRDLWLDGCHIHHTGEVCLSANSADTERLHLTRNHNSGDNVMQVQGEAVVRNNVLINGAGSGFASTDHQGKTVNLQVIHNTIINRTHAFRGGSWNSREGMVLANNIIYSRDANALHFPGGSAGVVIRGNVVLGGGPTEGCVKGRGLEDFSGLAWDASRRDANPAAGAPFDHADPRHRVATDFNGEPRGQTSGALAR
jgi:hypothetical protein